MCTCVYVRSCESGKYTLSPLSHWAAPRRNRHFQHFPRLSQNVTHWWKRSNAHTVSGSFHFPAWPLLTVRPPDLSSDNVSNTTLPRTHSHCHHRAATLPRKLSKSFGKLCSLTFVAFIQDTKRVHSDQRNHDYLEDTVWPTAEVPSTPPTKSQRASLQLPQLPNKGA